MRLRISFAKVMMTPPARVRKTVGTLARIVGLEAETDLHNAPAKQNQADRTDEAEDKVAEVVDDGNGSPAAKAVTPMLMVSGRGKDSHHINAVALLDLAGDLPACWCSSLH